MGWLKALWSEFIGLFVDDGTLAIAVLIWLGLCWLTLPRFGLAPAWPPVALFVGLASILAASTIRSARR